MNSVIVKETNKIDYITTSVLNVLLNAHFFDF